MTALFSKPIAQLILAVILIVAVLGTAYLGFREIRGMVDDAVELKGNERDAYWTAKIEKANAETNKRAADQAAAVVKIQAVMAEQSRSDQQTLADLRTKNAQLPKGDGKGGRCGLSGDRVGLLPD
ncbi:hypothetical protein ELH67_15855 [Rhizobium ruizarguesonis]|uniref:hypothetical protein n=1 Tax=Rhizobium ruizarguesonis TaxID=2081791 RepID=UPI00103249B3|nr:hypothetical protein [Rhizobium ruizarguesonis]TAZ95924.1 hypothetical protein ELH67_15855 [Rhizobium ruizarguesonis]